MPQFDYFHAPALDVSQGFHDLGEASARRAQALGTALTPLQIALSEQMRENRADTRQRTALDHERMLTLLTQEHRDAMDLERERRSHEARRSEILLEGETRMRVEDMQQRQAEARARQVEAARQAEEERKAHALAGGLEAALRMKGSKDSGIYEEHSYRLADVDPSMRGLSDDEILKRAQATRSPEAAKEFAKAMTKPQKARIVNEDRFHQAATEVARVYGKEGLETFTGAFKDEPRTVLELYGREIDKLGGDTVRKDLPARTAQETGTPQEFGSETGTPLTPQKVTGTNAENDAMRAPIGPTLVSSDLLKQAGAEPNMIAPPGMEQVYAQAIDQGKIGLQPILENPNDPQSRIKGYDVIASARTDPGILQKLQSWADSPLGKRGITAALLSKGTKGGLRPEQVEGRMFLEEPQRQAPATPGKEPLVPTPTPQPTAPKKLEDMNDVRRFLDSWSG